MSKYASRADYERDMPKRAREFAEGGERFTGAEVRLWVHNLADLADRLQSEVDRLLVGHDRYETARRMNPQQWADAWKLNISTGKPFDEIIDERRPLANM